MEIKKNESKNLEKKRSLFFQVGLFMIGSLTLAAFTYSTPTILSKEGRKVERIPIALDYSEEEKKTETEVFQDNASTSSTVDSEQMASEDIIEGSNEATSVNSQADVNLGNLLSGHDLSMGTDRIIIDLEDAIDLFPMKDAQYPGGYAAMQKFIALNLDYPQEAIELKQTGLVNVSFVVEKDGSISNVSIVRGSHELLNREAKRLIRNFPKWIPAESKYEKVRTAIHLPIRFEVMP
ncbi:MAG: energy transducer TonB [Bacteroidetes bacterium]|nr:energy transducer TonB [Bacteroidota bacterium]